MNLLKLPKSPAKVRKGSPQKASSQKPRKSVEKINYLVSVEDENGGKTIKLIQRFKSANDLHSLRYLVHYLVDQEEEDELREKIWVAKFSKEVPSAEVLEDVQPGQPLPPWKQTFLAKVDSWSVPEKVHRYRKKIKKETGYMWVLKTPDTKMLLK